MAESKWIAINHVGAFRRGHIYTRSQLGVLGRMAALSGHLIPYAEPEPVARAARKPGRPKKVTNGEAEL